MHAKPSIRTALVAFAMVFCGAAHADVYEIDKDHTEVRFTWDHVGMSRQGGRFRDVAGTLNFDPVSPGNSSVDVRIKVASISTGVPKLDEQLIRSGEFFDAQAFPTITFRSTSVAPSAGKTAQVTGNLSINGVTKPVILDVKWNYSGAHPLGSINPAYKETYVSGFSATTQILRSDWGISRTVPFISDELRITIESELFRTKITSPQLPPESAGAGPQPLPGSPPVAATQHPALEVPAPGEPPPPPSDAATSTLPPPAGSLPPVSEGPQSGAGAPAPLPDEAAPGAPDPSTSPGSSTSPDPSSSSEPLDPVDRFGDQKIDNGR